MKEILRTLDSEYKENIYKTVSEYSEEICKSLKEDSAVIFNGHGMNIYGCKREFQQKWTETPLTTHQLNGFDFHMIPGTGTYVVTVSCRVKFHESGRNRLETEQDFMGNDRRNLGVKRNMWGVWFGVNMSVVVDENALKGKEKMCVNSLNYRITHIPEDSSIII